MDRPNEVISVLNSSLVAEVQRGASHGHSQTLPTAEAKSPHGSVRASRGLGNLVQRLSQQIPTANHFALIVGQVGQRRLHTLNGLPPLDATAGRRHRPWQLVCFLVRLVRRIGGEPLLKKRGQAAFAATTFLGIPHQIVRDRSQPAAKSSQAAEFAAAQPLYRSDKRLLHDIVRPHQALQTRRYPRLDVLPQLVIIVQQQLHEGRTVARQSSIEQRRRVVGTRHGSGFPIRWHEKTTFMLLPTPA